MTEAMTETTTVEKPALTITADVLSGPTGLLLNARR